MMARLAECRVPKGVLSSTGEGANGSTEGGVSETMMAFQIADKNHKGYLTIKDYLDYVSVEKDNQLWIDYFEL